MRQIQRAAAACRVEELDLQCSAHERVHARTVAIIGKAGQEQWDANNISYGVTGKAAYVHVVVGLESDRNALQHTQAGVESGQVGKLQVSQVAAI
ncbi:MAG: hypothetical protein HC809_05175 [Gammaproteobacteria bacterium]|nr:hypothetical protein [Gammaproteobacteria bacterium]